MYRELDDTEILYMIQDNDDNYKIISEKYKPYLLKICKKYIKTAKVIGYDMEDLLQVANIGLIDAIRTYKINQNVLFYTYLTCCVENKLKTEIRNNCTNKKMVLNQALSYDVPVKGTDITKLELLPDLKCIDPLDYLLNEQKQIDYINFINSLSFEDAVIYELKINGFSVEEIASFLQIDQKFILKSLKSVKNRRRAYV